MIHDQKNLDDVVRSARDLTDISVGASEVPLSIESRRPVRVRLTRGANVSKILGPHEVVVEAGAQGGQVEHARSVKVEQGAAVTSLTHCTGVDILGCVSGVACCHVGEVEEGRIGLLTDSFVDRMVASSVDRVIGSRIGWMSGRIMQADDTMIENLVRGAIRYGDSIVVRRMRWSVIEVLEGSSVVHEAGRSSRINHLGGLSVVTALSGADVDHVYGMATVASGGEDVTSLAATARVLGQDGARQPDCWRDFVRKGSSLVGYVPEDDLEYRREGDLAMVHAVPADSRGMLKRPRAALVDKWDEGASYRVVLARSWTPLGYLEDKDADTRDATGR